MSDETKLDAPKPLADALLAGIEKAKAATAALDKRAGRDPDATADEPRKGLRAVPPRKGGPKLGVDLLQSFGPVSFLSRELGFTDGAGPPHMIAGADTSGKTLLSQHLLLSLAAGRSLAGKPRKPLRCLHLDYEQGKKTTAQRYQRLANAMGIDLRSLNERGALSLLVAPRVLLRPEDRDDWRKLLFGHDVVLIDSFCCATMGVADENSSTIRGPLDLLTALSEETRCRPILIHHFNKDSPTTVDRLRGSSAIRQAVDCLWTLRAEKEVSGKDSEILARNERPSRDVGDRAAPFGFTICDVAKDNPKWGLSVTLCAAQAISSRRAKEEAAQAESLERASVTRLLEMLAAHPAETIYELSLRLKQRKDLTARAILEAGPAVIVESRQQGRGRPQTVYRLAPAK
jgi:hypothetical protein